MSPREAGRLLGLSADGVYGLLNSGAIRSVKVGSRRLIPVDELRRYLVDAAEPVA